MEWRHLLDLRVVGQFEQGGEEYLERSLGLWFSMLGRGGTAGVLGVAMGLWLRGDFFWTCMGATYLRNFSDELNKS